MYYNRLFRRLTSARLHGIVLGEGGVMAAQLRLNVSPNTANASPEFRHLQFEFQQHQQYLRRLGQLVRDLNLSHAELERLLIEYVSPPDPILQALLGRISTNQKVSA